MASWLGTDSHAPWHPRPFRPRATRTEWPATDYAQTAWPGPFPQAESGRIGRGGGDQLGHQRRRFLGPACILQQVQNNAQDFRHGCIGAKAKQAGQVRNRRRIGRGWFGGGRGGGLLGRHGAFLTGEGLEVQIGSVDQTGTGQARDFPGFGMVQKAWTDEPVFAVADQFSRRRRPFYPAPKAGTLASP